MENFISMLKFGCSQNQIYMILSSISNILLRKSWLLDFQCVLLSCVCLCSVSRPCGAMGWSLVYDCGVPRLYFMCKRFYDFTVSLEC